VGTIKDTEVDFVAIKGDRKLYLQVALQLIEEQTIEREYRSLKLIEDNFDKYVVSMDDYKIPTNEGIEHISAWDLDEILRDKSFFLMRNSQLLKIQSVGDLMKILSF